MKNLTKIILLLIALLVTNVAFAYPLDGEPETGIQRLLIFQPELENNTGRLPSGALLKTDDIQLSLNELQTPFDFETSKQDTALQKALESIFDNRDPSYSVMVIDTTNPENILWAGIKENKSFNPGSVGKYYAPLPCLMH